MSWNLSYSLLVSFLLFISCDRSPHSIQSKWQQIAARDNGRSLNRPLLYRALVPGNWIREDPSAKNSIADTTIPNCTFSIEEEGQTLYLTIHTFPTLHGNPHIPPQTQILRWKRQFEELNPLIAHVVSESHGGFTGLFFEGEGILQGRKTKVMAWSMMLSPLYERRLSLARHPLDSYKGADYTIKVSGPPEIMNKHRADILTFASSFEFIDELPSS